jgi:hypothetical protein
MEKRNRVGKIKIYLSSTTMFVRYLEESKIPLISAVNFY